MWYKALGRRGAGYQALGQEHEGQECCAQTGKRLTNIELGPTAPGELRRVGSLGN